MVTELVVRCCSSLVPLNHNLLPSPSLIFTIVELHLIIKPYINNQILLGIINSINNQILRRLQTTNELHKTDNNPTTSRPTAAVGKLWNISNQTISKDPRRSQEIIKEVYKEILDNLAQRSRIVIHGYREVNQHQ